MSAQGSALARGTATVRQGRRGFWGMASKFWRDQPLGVIGAALVLLMVLVAVFAEVIAPYSPLETHRGVSFAPPSLRFWLGADELGRDVLSRVLYGTRLSLYVGLVSVLLGTTIGAGVGVVSGYMGKKVDILLQRIIDTVMAFPTLILALAIVAVLGPSLNNVVIAVSVVLIPRGARVLRSAALSVKENPYIEAARAIGCSNTRVLLRHVLPQCMAPYIIVATAAIGWAITVEATLNFLGVGAPPPTPSWGAMLSGAGRQHLETSPWIAISPGVALSLTVFGFSLLGDALRDVLDPRLRRA
ncbi:MAG: ABC transporter permease [Dehalococcoidia bacterium]|nr:ABC transporter permease [Dehalococcoidia bacterium]